MNNTRLQKTQKAQKWITLQSQVMRMKTKSSSCFIPRPYTKFKIGPDQLILLLKCRLRKSTNYMTQQNSHSRELASTKTLRLTSW